MKIVVANQKGGAGKTTIAMLLANYLTSRNKEVLVLDMDFQRSIVSRFEEDKELFSDQQRYEVIGIDMDQYPSLKPSFDSLEDGGVIIDLPGKIDDQHIVPIIEDADIIICPFRYDKITFESTLVFVQVVQHIKPNARLIFIPNAIKSTARYETKKQVDDYLKNIGKVTNMFPERIGFQRVNTFEIPEEIMPYVEGVFSKIPEFTNL